MMFSVIAILFLLGPSAGFRRPIPIKQHSISTRPQRLVNAVTPSSTRLEAIPPIITSAISAVSTAFANVKAHPSSLILPALLLTFGSAIPTIIQGVTSGESLNAILAPVLSVIERTLRKLPFVEYFIRRYVLKKNLVLPGVKLPLDTKSSINNFLTLTGTSQYLVVKFVASSLSDIGSIVGKPKKDAKSVEIFEEFHRDYVKFAVEPSGPFAVANALPADYRYFGNGVNFDNLPYFFKTNPFFIASVRSNSDSTFEIDPFGESGTTHFSEVTSCLAKHVPRVKATFDSKMNLMSMRVFDARDPTKEVTGVSQERAATLLLYQCSYYAQNIHATTHILHLLMTSAMVHSTKGTSLSSWAKPYISNLYLKYVEVETLLFSKIGYLSGTRPKSPGYDVVDREKLLKINKEMLSEWGTFKTAEEYIWKFLFKNVNKEKLIASGAAEAFLSQTDLVAPYARDMEVEFKKDVNFGKIESKLATFMSETGTGVSKLDSMRAWAEILSVTGILHGSTLSMSRLVLTHSFLSVNSPESSSFTNQDAAWTSVITGTILGCLEDFHVFSNSLPSNTPYNINRVLLEYDNKTNDLKAKYFKKISENEDIFKKFGWILTDHGPNLMDGKQLTITTYI